MREGMAFWEEGLADIELGMLRENDACEAVRELLASGALNNVTGIIIVTVGGDTKRFTWRSVGLSPDERELLAVRLARHLGG